MITETQAANAIGGKTARACDGCVRRRARWYCAADDAFLCQSCDTSIHSANQVASRHDRVRLRTSSSSSVLFLSSSLPDRTTLWYEGFTRKARTPRKRKINNNNNKVNSDGDGDAINSDNPVVPELGSEEISTFSSLEENLTFCVPVFDQFSDMDTDKNEMVDENSFGFSPDECNISTREDGLDEKPDDRLDGFLDVDLADFAMDVESLLGEESCVDVREQLGFLEFKEERIDIDDINNNVTLKGVKDEEEGEEEQQESNYGRKLEYRGQGGGGREEEETGKIEETCRKDEETLKRSNYKRMFLRLDYEAVINAWDSHGSPWTSGCRPEFNRCDCWPDCVLQAYVCPNHVLNSGSKETTAISSMPRHQEGRHAVSDGEREARVLRYKEKRRTRLFEKKIRYEVRKLNAEKRPRIKGRFVKRTSLLGTH